MRENEVGTGVVEATIEVHRRLGNGLLESVYDAVIAVELERRGFSARRQVPITIEYRGAVFEEGFRADLLVGDIVLLELKSVERINNAHKKQLLTYLKLTGMKLGFLLNFGAGLMRDGIVRTVNNL